MLLHLLILLSLVWLLFIKWSPLMSPWDSWTGYMKIAISRWQWSQNPFIGYFAPSKLRTSSLSNINHGLDWKNIWYHYKKHSTSHPKRDNILSIYYPSDVISCSHLTWHKVANQQCWERSEILIWILSILMHWSKRLSNGIHEVIMSGLFLVNHAVCVCITVVEKLGL